MKRRGSSFFTTEMAPMLKQFRIGDVVYPLFVPLGRDSIRGIVADVVPTENKVYVAWNGGPIKQHDPDEIQVDDLSARRVASMSAIAKADEEDDPQYVGDPKTHGMEEPRGGGFSIMQNLADDLHEESYEEAEEGPKIANLAQLRSRRAMYFKEKGRVYKTTRGENTTGLVVCPKCRADMDLQPFTKSTKIYICPECGFKISTDKIV